MKKLVFILVLAMVTVFTAEAHKYKKAHVTISYQTFYNELSPYGDWVYTPEFGYVWRPYFDNPEAFRPYSSNGYWVNTSYGWSWVSDYRWGWAAFHYGRWNFDNYMGWVWIPGYEWAPAWVTWGSYGDCWGWAPLGPEIYVHSSIDWYAPAPWWTFVPRRHFCSDNWNYYIYDRPVHVNNITYVTNVYENNTNNYYGHRSGNSWYSGPGVNEVERYSQRRVRSVEIAESDSPESVGIRNNRLNVYRPAVEGHRNDARPGEYRSVEQVRRESTSITTNARSNNPGENRVRGQHSIDRNMERGSATNTTGERNGTRYESRTSSQVSRSESSETRGVKPVSPANRSQSGSQSGSIERDSRTEPRTAPATNGNRNQTRVSADVNRGNQSREYTRNTSERGSTGTSRNEVKINNSFPHDKTTTREISDRVKVQTSERAPARVERNENSNTVKRESSPGNSSSSSREDEKNGKPRNESRNTNSSVDSRDRR